MAEARRITRDKIIDIDPETGRMEHENIEASLESDQDKNLDDVLAEFDKTDDDIVYTARINRVVGSPRDGVKEPYLFSVDASLISGVRDRLRDVYGTGTYRIRVYKNNKICRQLDYHIEAPKGGLDIKVANGSETALIIETMRENQKSMMEMMERLTGRNTPVLAVAPVDPFQQMERMSVIMKNLREADPPRQVSDTSLDTFMKAAEFTRDLQGDSSGSGSWVDVLKAALSNPAIGETISAIAAQRNEQRNPRRMMRRPMVGNLPGPQNQMPQHQPPNNPQNGNEQNSGHALGKQLESNIRYLIGRAEQNRDPQLYAEWLLDNIDQDLIKKMVDDPNLLTQLEAGFPRLVQHREWFAALIEEVKSFIAGEGQPESDDGDLQATEYPDGNARGQGGDARHAETHVGLGEEISQG